MKENSFSVFNLGLLESALVPDQETASLLELCEFLEIEFEQGNPDSVLLFTRSFSILENHKFSELQNQEQQLRILKAAAEVVGFFFMSVAGLSKDDSELLQ